jgi:hypothetical protein
MSRRISPAILVTVLVIASSAASAQTTAPAKVYASAPTGEGDPDGITCRPPQTLPGQRLLGPEVCKKNDVWAQYRKDGMDVSADGLHDVPSQKMHGCRVVTSGGGGGATSGGTVNTSTICD